MSEVEFSMAMEPSLKNLQSNILMGIEAADIKVLPGVYGPNCDQHVALETNDWWRKATVKAEDGSDYTFQDAVVAWYQGATIAIIDTVAAEGEDGPSSSCVAVDGER
jgi:hypothetical protein